MYAHHVRMRSVLNELTCKVTYRRSAPGQRIPILIPFYMGFVCS